MRISNKKAKFNYKLLEIFEAGMSLTGAEVKAIKAGKVDLTNSYAKVIGREIFLINTTISSQNARSYNPTRTRKLLLHKKEINKIETKIKTKKLTLVPVSIYTIRGLIKVKIALAKSKKTHQKKEILKKADLKREMERELKDR